MNTVKEFLMRQLGMKLCADECCAQIADLMANPECFGEYTGPALKKEAEEVCDLLNKPELNTKVQERGQSLLQWKNYYPRYKWLF